MKKKSEKHPFKVPENYFSDLERQIKSKVKDKGQDSKVISIKPALLKVAATVLLLLTISIVLYKKTNTDPIQIAGNSEVNEILKDIPDEAIIEYLTESNLEVEQLINFAASKNINETELEEKNEIEEEILKDYIDNYL
ncbi:hypothetical protein OO013_15345 [Mangrovivirga sp. M17]|uniref:Uncharacterized protein n=1 Tax=Mangrovivirga halotolerans TaxID=2993936 RepID=A0ABT3RVI3_9BACT|nr:hypothetical protein [Mangrovivirga halotolerans]MCX2745252.1 hypothetical protein [Mangrovivirga halotolerans]